MLHLCQPSDRKESFRGNPLSERDEAPILIRAAGVEDYPGIRDLFQTPEELFRVYPDGEWPFTLEQVERIAKERVDLTVVTAGEKVVGFANFYRVDGRRSAFLGNVVIAEAYRGRGLGRALVERMLKRAFEERKMEELRLSVFADNTPALLLYDALGFTPYGLEARTDPHGGKKVLLHMRRCR